MDEDRQRLLRKSLANVGTDEILHLEEEGEASQRKSKMPRLTLQPCKGALEEGRKTLLEGRKTVYYTIGCHMWEEEAFHGGGIDEGNIPPLPPAPYLAANPSELDQGFGLSPRAQMIVGGDGATRRPSDMIVPTKPPRFASPVPSVSLATMAGGLASASAHSSGGGEMVMSQPPSPNMAAMAAGGAKVPAGTSWRMGPGLAVPNMGAGIRRHSNAVQLGVPSDYAGGRRGTNLGAAGGGGTAAYGRQRRGSGGMALVITSEVSTQTSKSALRKNGQLGTEFSRSAGASEDSLFLGDFARFFTNAGRSIGFNEWPKKLLTGMVWHLLFGALKVNKGLGGKGGVKNYAQLLEARGQKCPSMASFTYVCFLENFQVRNKNP